ADVLQPAAAMSRSVPAAPALSRAPSITTIAALVLAVPVVAIAAIALFELANWDKVTPGVTALGTQIGGFSKQEAVTRLTPAVQQLLDRPLTIQGNDKTWNTTARDLGLRLDPNELVAAAYQVGRGGAPTDRLGEQFDTL